MSALGCVSFRYVSKTRGKTLLIRRTIFISTLTNGNSDAESLSPPFSLTIVDTLGFGDTEGIERDKEITFVVHDFFKHENGIQVISKKLLTF